MASISKKTKLADLINFRLRVSVQDGRTYTGQLLAFDKHLNLVVADTEEARVPRKAYQQLVKQKAAGQQVKASEEKRFLGLIILRGEQVVNLTIVSAPTADTKKRLAQLKQGKGVVKPVRGAAGAKGPRVGR